MGWGGGAVGVQHGQLISVTFDNAMFTMHVSKSLKNCTKHTRYHNKNNLICIISAQVFWLFVNPAVFFHKSLALLYGTACKNLIVSIYVLFNVSFSFQFHSY